LGSSSAQPATSRTEQTARERHGDTPLLLLR
jgi:hypothetical protein